MARLDVSTKEPLEFFNYLKNQNEELHRQVKDLIIFEEVSAGQFRMQKLYREGVWNQKNERNLDLIWFAYCELHP